MGDSDAERLQQEINNRFGVLSETLDVGRRRSGDIGSQYVAANGANMDNYGQKRIRNKKVGLSGNSDMFFQVTDVGKPLASVTRILDKGNTVVFWRKPGGFYIVNNRRSS